MNSSRPPGVKAHARHVVIAVVIALVFLVIATVVARTLAG
jgi:hypothetical protein